MPCLALASPYNSGLGPASPLPRRCRALLWPLHCSASHCYDLPSPLIVSLCLCPAPHFNGMQTDAFATRFDDSLRPCFAMLRCALLRSAFAEPRARILASPTLRPSLPFSAEPCLCFASRVVGMPRVDMPLHRFATLSSSPPLRRKAMLCRCLAFVGMASTCRSQAAWCRTLLCLCFVMPLGAKPLPSLSVPFDSARRYDMPLPRRAQLFSDVRCLCFAMREREMPHHAFAAYLIALPLLGSAAPRLTTHLPCRA